jgi:apolipoprotein D and lipocalin family protein
MPDLAASAVPGMRRLSRYFAAICLTAGALTSAAPPPLQALPALEVTGYMGLWYQVAWYPNRFQSQCVSDTRANYSLRADGRIEVVNRCTLLDGRSDEALGIARPVGRIEGPLLQPAQLEVSFLPAILRWLPFGWGNYWVVDLAPDGRYALVSEPTREYLWVLARQPQLAPSDEAAVRETLARLGFDLQRLVAHPQRVP